MKPVSNPILYYQIGTMDKGHNLTDIYNEMETTSSRVCLEDINKPTNRKPPREAIDIREKFMKYLN